MISYPFIFLIFYVVHSKVLMTLQEKHFQIEVGQSYSQSIPLLFTKFQHSKIEEFKRQTPYYQKSICTIKQSQKGILKLINTIEHTNGSEIENFNSKNVYRFQDLKTLRVFVDAYQTQTLIVAAFTSGQVVYYVIQQKSGTIHAYQKKKVLDQQIQDARFVLVNNSLLLFTPKSVIKMHLDGNYEIVSGYKPFAQMFNDIKSNGDYVYIGAADEGLVVYKYHFQNNSISLISNTTFYLQSNSSSTDIDVDQFQIDTNYESDNLIYVLDRQQGLFAYSLEDVYQNGSIGRNKLKVLMGGCQHFVLSAFNIYLTCPELIILNKKGVPLDMKHNSFYPYDISLLDSRIYIYGYQQLAVYDLFGTVLQQHSLNTITQKSFILKDYIISFSDTSASSSRIVSQKQELYCYTSSEDRVGRYTGRYVSSGLCSQYLFGPEDNKQICQISYPFLLVVKNSAFVDYKVEIIVVCVWILLMAIIALIFTIRHHVIHKSYKQLIQQQTNQNIQMVAEVNLKKGSTQEVN